MDTFLFVIFSIFFLKSVWIGSKFSFYNWIKYKKDYWNWYEEKITSAEYNTNWKEKL